MWDIWSWWWQPGFPVGQHYKVTMSAQSQVGTLPLQFGLVEVVYLWLVGCCKREVSLLVWPHKLVEVVKCAQLRDDTDTPRVDTSVHFWLWTTKAHTPSLGEYSIIAAWTIGGIRVVSILNRTSCAKSTNTCAVCKMISNAPILGWGH